MMGRERDRQTNTRGIRRLLRVGRRVEALTQCLLVYFGLFLLWVGRINQGTSIRLDRKGSEMQ